MAFYKAGKALAELHLNYEQVPPSPDVVPHIADAVYQEPTDDAPFGYTKYDHFAVDKMAFRKCATKPGNSFPTSRASSTTATSPLRIFRPKPTNIASMANPLSSGLWNVTQFPKTPNRSS